jgi:hypothetical protein
MEDSMFRTKIFSTLMFAAAFLTLGAFSGALAQGRYANQYSRNDVNNIIQRLEESSNTFRTDFRDQMNRNRINGTSDEGRFNGIVADYENSLDRLRRRFDRGDNWWQSRNEVQNVMNNARLVNDMMNSIQFRRNLERQWNRMRNDINKLADTFDLPGLNGGGWNGGGYPGAGGQGNVPNWAQGTFYARNPETGGTIVMTVNRNGSVSISFDGNQPIYASLNRTTLTNGQFVSRVSQINNGIRTTDVRNGSYIDYFRTPINSGGGWSGGQGNVPNWAEGTFFARNPETGGTIAMTIQRNGSVMITFDGSNTVYASLNGTTLTNGQYVSRLTRINNGIRTTDVNNGSYIDYHRR